MAEFEFPSQTSMSDSISAFGETRTPVTGKKDRVARAAEAKQMLLGAGNNFEVLSTAILEGNDLGMSPLAQELANRDVGSLANDYGMEVAALAAGLQNAMRRVEHDRTSKRDFRTIKSDAELGIGAGAVQTLGGVVALGTGLIDADAGAWVANKVNQGADYLREHQSGSLQRKRDLGQIRSNLDQQDINTQYQQDVDAGDTFAGIKRFGREFAAKGVDFIQNPALAGDAVSEGIGSFAVSGGITKIAATGAAKVFLRNQGMSRQAAAAFLKTDDGAALVRNLTEKGMPVGIGLMEGGGAYTQIQGEIQAMSEEELMSGSPEYYALRQEGYTHEGARNVIANIAGREGGAIQGLVGAATGRLVSKFESNPFRSSKGSFTEKLSEFGGNILRESVEEGIQEGSSDVISADAVRRHADPDRDIFEGLGGSVATGAVAGAGMAAGLQGPSVAVTGSVGVAKKAVSARLNSIQERIDNESPVGQQAFDRAAQDLSTIGRGISPESSTNVTSPATVNVRSTLLMTGEELNNAPESVKSFLFTDPDTGEKTEIPNTSAEIAGRGDLLFGAVEALRSNKDLSDAERGEIYLWIHEQARKLDNLQNQDLSNESAEIQEAGSKAIEASNVILSNAKIKEAMKKAETITSDDFGPLPEVNETTIETPEVQRAANNQVMLSMANPAGVDPRFIGDLLSQRKIQFPDYVIKGLKLAREIALEANEAADLKSKIAEETQAELSKRKMSSKPSSPTDIVRKQIMDTGKNKEKGQLGLSGHQSRIVTALSNGDISSAQRSMDALGNFAQSLLNKVDAARASYGLRQTSNNKVKYDVWDGDQWITDGGSVYITPFSPKSIQTGREIAVDAGSAVRIYNALLAEYGDVLTGSPKEIVTNNTNEMSVIDKENDAQTEILEKTETSIESGTSKDNTTQEEVRQETTKDTEKPEQKLTTNERNSDVQGTTEKETTAETPIVAEDNIRSKEPSNTEEVGEEAKQESDKSGDNGPLTLTETKGLPEATAFDETASEPEFDTEQEAREAAELEEKAREEETSAEADRLADEKDARRFPKFPNLVKTKNSISRFMRAIKVDTEKSRAVGLENPLDDVAKILKDLGNGVVNERVAFKVEKARVEELIALVKGEGKNLHKLLNERLTKKTIKVIVGENPEYKPELGRKAGNTKYLYEKVSPLEYLKEKDDVTDRANGKALTIIDETTNQYNKQLLESAILATLDWLINTEINRVPMTRKDIAEYKNIPEWKVTRGMMRAFNSSYRPETARDSLAKSIMEFWGATKKSGVTVSDTMGIPSGVAAEILDALLELGLVQEHRIKLEEGDDALESLAITLGPKGPAWSMLVRNLGYHRNLLKDLILSKYESKVYLDEIPRGEVRTQKGNVLEGVISRKQQDAIDAERAVRHMPTLMAPLLVALGEDTYTRMMGYEESDASLNHIQTQESINGKNRGLKRSYQLTVDHWNKVVSFAKDRDPFKVSTHYDYKFMPNSRMMALGFNGQNDKVMRHAFAPTEAELDISPNSEDLMMLWRAIGQMADLVKPELLNDGEVIETTRKKLDELYSGSIQVFDEYLDTGVFTKEMKDTLIAEFSEGTQEAETVHAVFTATRLFRAQLDGETTFKTHLPLEADGKTDGPFHAITQYLSDGFNEIQLKALRKGGMFLGKRFKTLAEYFQTKEGEEEGDLYQFGALQMMKLFNDLKAEFRRQKASKELTEQITSLENMLNMFGGIEFDDNGNLVIGRNVLKNPLTITIYGSGADGIANKIAYSIIEKFNKAISDVLKLRAEFERNNPGKSSEHIGIKEVLFVNPDQQTNFEKHMRNMFTRRVAYYSVENEYYVSWNVQMDRDDPKSKVKAPLDFRNKMSSDALRKFEFSGPNKAMLAANIRTGFVDPMVAAVDIVTDGAPRKAKIIQKASQVQAKVLKAVFEKAVYDRMREKEEAGERAPNEGLSEDDYKKIFQDLGGYAAVVGSVDGTTEDMMHVNLSTKERSDEKRTVASALNGRWDGPVALPGPSEAGVKAMSLVTISEGDARMMANYFAEVHRRGEVSKTQQVYDGLEMPIDLAQQIQEQINKADADAIMENVMSNVADSFSDFLRQDTWSIIEGDRALIEELLVLFVGQAMADEMMQLAPGDVIPMVKREISALKHELHQKALGVAARKEAMKDVGFSLEHMAGARQSYTMEGRLDIGLLSDTDLLDKLNERYKHHLKKAVEKSQEKAKVPDIAEPDEKLVEALKPFGRDNLGITSMSLKNFSKVLGSLNLSDEHRAILNVMSGGLADFKVMVGPRAALNLARNTMFPNQAGLDPIEYGLTDIQNKIIYIANESVETALHEMLHAASAAIMHDYYTDPTLVSETARQAIKNLEALMKQFMGLTFEFEGAATQSAALNAQSEIATALSIGTPVAKFTALQEFMAWTLTNQRVIDTLKKTKNRSKLVQLKDAVLKGLKKLLGLPHGVSLDMFSNIKWNAGAMLRSSRLDPRAELNRGASFSHLLHQRLTDSRLRELTNKFEQRIAAHIRKVDPLDQAIEEHDINEVSLQALNRITSHGVYLDQAQAAAFRSIHAAMASTMKFDNGAMVRAQKIFRHVLSGLKVEDLMKSKGDDFHPADRAQAEDLFNVLTGKFGTETDPQGRSTMLSTFLALSQVSPQFREMLENVNLPKATGLGGNTVDEMLTNAANHMIDRLANAVAGDSGKSQNVRIALDSLAGQLARIERDNRNLIERKTQSLLTDGDAYGKRLLSKVSEKLDSFGDEKTILERKTIAGEAESILRKSAKVLGSLMDETKGKAMGSAIISLGNTQNLLPDTLIKMVNEVVGITDENRGVYELMNRVKYNVSALRQDHREKVPDLLAEKFSRKLEKYEWEAMHLVLALTDIAALGGTLSIGKIREILQNGNTLRSEIKKTEEVVRGKNKKLASLYMKKADELAEFMVTGKIAAGNHNLLRNAEAISLLLGEAGSNKITAADAKAIQPAIDQLTSLLALEKIKDRPELKTVQDLVSSEQDGVDFIIYYLAQQRQVESSKATTEEARLNAYKGYVPAETPQGADLRIEDESNYAKMISLGYTRIGDYKGSGFEKGRRGYYFSTVGGNNTFNQGIMQTVQKTANGVDIQTGRTITGITGGVLAKGSVADVQAWLKSGTNTLGAEPLMPIYGAQGKVVAYERSLNPEHLEKLKKNKHLGEMAGAWSGRIAEEQLAEVFNRQLIDRLKDVWDDQKGTRKDEFINLADPALENQLWKDAWNLVPPETKEYISEIFGEDRFMVRKDMIDNTVGYRSLTVGEAWSGPSELNEPVKKLVRDVTTVILGRNAYKSVVTAEKAWQTGISVAKQTIVIRSFIVPASNIASNVLQLMTNGVGIRAISKGFPEKLVEIDKHLKNQARKVEIQVELSQYGKNNIKRRKLEAELKTLDDSSRRMSIWPLIEAGEFSTISEGLTEADAAIAQGKWSEWIQQAVDSVPAKLGTAGRYFGVTRDTALFQGMSRAVQYGDFLAKAVLYDHLVSQKKMDQAEAMNKITEEFVNYNLLPGQVRSYAESMGLAWFWAYKLRSLKIAHRTIRDNPLRALLTSIGMPMLPEPVGVSVGAPITDNALSVIADGRAGYSLGLGMLWNAPNLNPWINMVR